LARNRILCVLHRIAVADDGDRKLPVTGIRLHLIVATHGEIDSDGPLSCGIKEIERLVSNAPIADGKIDATGKSTDARQNCYSPLHGFHPITFDSINGVETWRGRGEGRWAQD
jgi:hypothetical protein